MFTVIITATFEGTKTEFVKALLIAIALDAITCIGCFA